MYIYQDTKTEWVFLKNNLRKHLTSKYRNICMYKILSACWHLKSWRPIIHIILEHANIKNPFKNWDVEIIMHYFQLTLTNFSFCRTQKQQKLNDPQFKLLNKFCILFWKLLYRKKKTEIYVYKGKMRVGINRNFILYSLTYEQCVKVKNMGILFYPINRALVKIVLERHLILTRTERKRSSNMKSNIESGLK